MIVSPEILKFVEKLEAYAGQKMHYPVELGVLLQCAAASGRTQELNELCFQAKFLVRTNEIIKRIGPGGEGYEKLVSEFQLSAQKINKTIQELMKNIPEEDIARFKNIFNDTQGEGVQYFINFMIDVSWLKNWQVDGNLMPFEKNNAVQENSKREEGGGERTIRSLAQIQRSASMSVVLLIVYLVVDSPVTFLGWLLSLGIAAFLLYIIFEIYYLSRTQK